MRSAVETVSDSSSFFSLLQRPGYVFNTVLDQVLRVNCPVVGFHLELFHVELVLEKHQLFLLLLLEDHHSDLLGETLLVSVELEELSDVDVDAFKHLGCSFD